MISYIQGKVIDVQSNYVEILTQSGIGYEILLNEKTSLQLQKNSNIELFIYHQISENFQSLFGFLEKSEKDIFKELIKISGIGGKLALQILSLDGNILLDAIYKENINVVQTIKGVGKKMAEKIILELKEKDFLLSKKSYSNIQDNANIDIQIINSIRITLVEMGYKIQDVEKILQIIPKELNTIDEILPFMIGELS